MTQYSGNFILNAGVQGQRIAAPLSGTVTPGNWIGVTLPNGFGPSLPSGQQMHFEYLLPAQYSTNFIYPLMVHMHPNGEGTGFYTGNPTNYLSNESGADTWYNQATTWRRNYPCIVVVPYCDQSGDPSGGANANFGGWVPEGDLSENGIGIHGQGNEHAVVSCIQYLQNTLNLSIDKTRIYATGDSLGGIGSWALMWDYSRSPAGAFGQVFAAVAPYAGVLEYNNFSGSVTGGQSALAAQLNVFAVSGVNDGTSRVGDWNQPMWRALSGNSNYPGYPGGQAGTSKFHYLQDPGQGHDIWDVGGPNGRGYRPLPDGAVIYDWLFAQIVP